MVARRRGRTEFHALPVGQGDAFIVRSDDFIAMIDGGRSQHRILSFLPKDIRSRGLDVLVCTHNDADHANGVIGLIEAGIQCEELWLPGRWTARLFDLILTPNAFAKEIVADIERLEKNLEDLTTPVLEDIATQHDSAISDNLPPADSSRIEKTRETIDYLLDLTPFDHEMLIWPNFPTPPRRWTRLFIEAVAAGERIRRIALAAHTSGIPIRWLEYGPGAYQAGPFSCVNGHETASLPHDPPISALLYLSLTVQNKESLVCLFSAENAPPVLLAADSDLSFSNSIPWADGMLITAPHHGSDANSAAYQRVSREQKKGSATWVRSDGWYPSRPGSCYQQQPLRYCTRCNTNRAVQSIRFTIKSARWTTRAHSCRCSTLVRSSGPPRL